MAGLFETVRQFFADEGWTTIPLEGSTGLRMKFQGKAGQWLCLVRVREPHGQVVFYSICPASVPSDRRAAVVELVTRANYGMITGNFEVDLTDGEVRFKASLDLGPSLSPEAVSFPQVFGRLVGNNLAMMDRYLPGIVEVIDGRSPEEVYDEIEQAAPLPAV